MKNDDLLANASLSAETTDSRRQFLHHAGIAAGALILTRALPTDAQNAGETTAPSANAPAVNAPAVNAPATVSTVLNLSEHPDLQKVGGWEIFPVGGERVIVAHAEAGFIACSAVCPHKGCDVEYRLADKQLVCPCHNSRFDEAGKVVKGPAKTDLKPFEIANTLVVKAR